MIYRPFWIEKIKNSWNQRPLIWLSGVRRSGKTTLTKMLSEVNYLNCDLPSVNRRLEDPEFFFKTLIKKSPVIFDEIHRIDNPSIVLKIGVDEYADLKILATGSSTLSATQKFKDSLTGRKINLYLPPVLWTECKEVFNINDLDHRLIRGGLPELLLAEKRNTEFYAEWIDSYYARDIQELFNVRNRSGFLKLLNLLFLQSGGILEIASLSKESGLSRPTVMSHLEALNVAHAVYMVQPFFGGGEKEIVKRPKMYAFDTGFICYVRGWNEIRETDRGILWEHLVLDMLRVKFGKVFYWKDKDKNEIDFVIKDSNGIHVFECKVNPGKYDNKALSKFRRIYPEGKNYCVSPFVEEPYKLRIRDFIIEFISSPS